MNADQRRALVYGLIVLAGFVAIDIALGNSRVSGAYALGAIVAGVLGGFRPALWVAVAGLVAAAISPFWNHDLGDEGYFARLFVAACGSLLALGAGRLRDEVIDQLARQELLSAVADLPVAGESLFQTAARVNELLVPRYAGYAAIEADVAGVRAPIGSRGTEPIEASDRISTPLRARGIAIGTLTIGAGRGGTDDPEFLRVFGGRVALALDNAGLSQELISVEQRLQAILENLGEAVTVQDRHERVVFANQAAADLLNAASVDELMEAPLEELRGRFRYTHEDGSPLEPEELPARRVLAGLDAEPLLLRRIDLKTGAEQWQITKSKPVLGPDGEALLVVHVIEDVTETKRAEIGQRLLADASEVLTSSLPVDQMLGRVAELAVGGIADRCAFLLATGDRPERVALAGAPREVPGEVDRAVRALAGGDPERSHDVADGVRSLVVAPLRTAERTVGALTLATGESQRRLSAYDVELARELARRVATALETARLYSQVERVATTLQRSLLPPQLPNVPGWTLRALYLPAGGEADVGGDFYDVFPTAAGWMAVMGDVVGRGPAAASLTAMGRYTLRTAGSLVGTPTMGLARLNDNLRERDEMALCTVAVVLLREDTSEASVVCAGHPLPYLIRAGEAHPVGRTGPLLGAFEQGHWLAASLDLDPGDVLVLYTDGVTDARGRDDRFGEERLKAALTGVQSAGEAVDRIQSRLKDFGGHEQDDDTAVLALQKL